MKHENKLHTKHSEKEQAEAHIFPNTANQDENDRNEIEFLLYRRKRMREMTENQVVFSRLLQLRYQLEDYLNGDKYIPEKSFSYFLKEYLKTIDRKKKEFAYEVQVHETKLSQILNNRVEPNEKFMVRLEIHSQNLFPALYWFKLLRMKKEYELSQNRKLRKEENRFVKNALQLGF
jgi:plasmid maintenance system antidote protein VapI